MKLRLPPFATIVRPSPEDDFVIPGAEDVGQIPPGRPPSAIQRAGGRSSAFSEAFTALMGENVRTKPSYTDCWVASVPELRPIASYMTDMGSVLIGLSEGGETVYSVTPREYAYPDPLNAVVMDVIDTLYGDAAEGKRLAAKRPPMTKEEYLDFLESMNSTREYGE